MKKKFLMMLSWAIMMMGACTFASCGDDDDDDDNDNKKEETSGNPFVAKYAGKYGAFIDGDYVVNAMGITFMVFHFDSETSWDKVYQYTNCMSKFGAESAYQQYLDQGLGDKEKELKIEGVYVSYLMSDPEMYEKDITKQQLCDEINETYEGFNESFGTK